MKISLNGELVEVCNKDDDLSIADFLKMQGYGDKKIAVANNGDFVPRSEYQNTLLSDQDQLDILSAVQGG